MEKQKILIVDDSEMNRYLLMDILEDQYDIVEAENGAEAITILSQQRAEFSLLLLDIMMPEMDGFEVLNYINKYHWNGSFAVMMISSDDSPANIKLAYDLGAFDYISRPFDPTVVQRRISNTMILYARQQHLEDVIAEQFYEQEKNNRLMISVLSHIVEFRNGESGLHVLHVNAITHYLLTQLVKITDKYPLSKSDITLISTASSLHDIGKISIPDEILNKPGRLTDEEFEIIKTHSLVGAKMLSELPTEQLESPLVKVAYEICRWHHERYDGRGYPDRLKGDEIPISAQVVALADVYDALTSERCYKKAYSHEEALAMILDGQCGTFNPILLQCLKEISHTLQNELANATPDQVTSSIQEIRNVIDYDRLFSDSKYTLLSHEQQHPKALYADSLTDTYNRRYFEEQFRGEEYIQAAAVIDIDNIKLINDNYGYDAGDVVIKKTAKMILSCVQRTGTVVRFGDDKFVVVFYGIHEDLFEKRLEKIRHAVEVMKIEEYPEINATISVSGVYGMGQAMKLVELADSKLRQAKSEKNKVVVCSFDKK